MLLRDLIDGLDGARLVGDGAVPIRAVQDDSRKVERGDLFVAVRGTRSDGHAFVPTAIERGAAAIVVEHEVAGATVPQVIVPHGARAFGVLVARALGDPASKMTLVGITGTNGKTTTTYLVESILEAAGAKPGVIGTVNYRYGGQVFDSPYTTPTPAVLHETFAKMLAAGCTHVVMETSSAALAMDRLAGLGFAAAGFSNLTQDHLDVHGTMEAYRDAKRLLFSRHLAKDGVAVVNVDDPEGLGMGAAAGSHRVLRVSAEGRPADVAVVEQESTVRGIRARVATPRGALAVESRPLVGHYNVANLALAIGIGEALGLPHDAIARGIAALKGVPGRVEHVANDADLDVLVDYAHTPDALRNVLTALRPLTTRRLICVFGCGGDRDPTKRPKMGAAVAELADVAVVTSDNPRTEDPRAIIDMILPAVPNAFVVDPDRRNAIRAAIAEATPGDVVVIAGKGHEDYQILGTTKIHFDDREEAAAAIALRPRWTRGAASWTRVVIDSRIAAPGDLYVAIQGETHDGHAFVDAAVDRGATAVMVERGRGSARVPSIEVADTRVALGELARDHRRAWKGTLVAITGSAGKTTTKELTAAALRGAATTHAATGSLNNETGVPLTVLAMRAHHRFAVIEMGMRGRGQIEYLTKIAEPDVAVVVNAGTAHIELLGSTDAIVEAKSEIWLGLRPGGTVIRPAGDPRLATWAGAHAPGAKTLTFGEETGADVRLTSYAASGPHGSHLDLEIVGAKHTLHLPLLGKHAAIDACCAIASAIACGVSVHDALAGLARAKPAAMRGEVVTIGGRHVIVDCYNANPASMEASLRTLAELARGKTGVAVLGDMLELGDHARGAHDAIGALAGRLGVKVIALGAWKDVVAGAAGSRETTDDPAAAARAALALAEPGDWILVKASRGMRLERVVAAMREVAV
jgi:murE/murF fusion protein